MKYTKEESLSEIRRRGRLIRKKRNNMITGVLSASVIVSTFILVLSVSMLTGNTVTGTGSVYGSFLMPVEAMGYVIVAVAAFTLGIVITVYFRKKK